MDGFLSRVTPLIADTVVSLAVARFRSDPVVSCRRAHLASITMSAYKRHGSIIELAIFERLRESNRLHVWREPRFLISRSADSLVTSQNIGDAFQSSLPYGDDTARTVQLDLIVYDTEDECIRSYEIKRANGWHDSQKTQQIKRNLRCVQTLLKSYAERNSTRFCRPIKAESWIICYYGAQAPLYRPHSLVREQLDEHFSFPVVGAVEAATAYYSRRIEDILAAVDRGVL